MVWDLILVGPWLFSVASFLLYRNVIFRKKDASKKCRSLSVSVCCIDGMCSTYTCIKEL